MTRIISGFAGSLRLATPGPGTRPTSDRVREAVFSALDARGVLPGARVLDLFAGSGALGLEAASRGAASVILVEHHAGALLVCRKNAALILRNAPQGSPLVIEANGRTVQAFLHAEQGCWDIALLDPPYDLPEPEIASTLGALVPRLTPGAIVLLERGSRSPEPQWPHGLERDRSKVYGDTTLWWARSTKA